MRSAKDFFAPLAVGAPAPLREIPVPMDYPRTRQDLTRPEIVALREQLVDMLRKQVTV